MKSFKHLIKYDSEGSERRIPYLIHRNIGNGIWWVGTLFDGIRLREARAADEEWWARQPQERRPLSYTELMARDIKHSWKWKFCVRWYGWFNRVYHRWLRLYQCFCPICLEEHY